MPCMHLDLGCKCKILTDNASDQLGVHLRPGRKKRSGNIPGCCKPTGSQSAYAASNPCDKVMRCFPTHSLAARVNRDPSRHLAVNKDGNRGARGLLLPLLQQAALGLRPCMDGVEKHAKFWPCEQDIACSSLLHTPSAHSGQPSSRRTSVAPTHPAPAVRPGTRTGPSSWLSLLQSAAENG